MAHRPHCRLRSIAACKDPAMLELTTASFVAFHIMWYGSGMCSTHNPSLCFR